RLIDKLRKQTREDANQDKLTHEKICNVDHGNYRGSWKLPMVDPSGVAVADEALWKYVKLKLTANQWKWVQGHIIEGMTLREIARQEGVSIEAVKSWARQAKKKLRDDEDVLKRLYG